ncbi:O-linked GlcNAc transferase [hydrothermal vent metagenome]|uniref:O-linked GlcNAc transferase n=1 Tax=hydrothermal vent metagenome TaxID=652676 RepID=A0A1W1BW03_9ZZZZ
MTIFQLILFISALVIFYIFFKKLFSEDYPKRGVDFEAKQADEQIGGISRPDKTFSKPTVRPSRLDELLSIADKSVEKGDLVEAKKALQSANILDKENPAIISRYAFVLNAMNDLVGAKEEYSRVLELEPNDDMAEASLGNILHKLGEDDEAISHHKRSIELDPEYAPHYYNYANTLYDLDRLDEALKLYEKAYSLDSDLKEAKDMISELKSKVA